MSLLWTVLPKKMWLSGSHPNPHRSSAKRVRCGEEEQNECALTFEKSRSKRSDACSDVCLIDKKDASSKLLRREVFCSRYLFSCSFTIHRFLYITSKQIRKVRIGKVSILSKYVILKQVKELLAKLIKI